MIKVEFIVRVSISYIHVGPFWRAMLTGVGWSPTIAIQQNLPILEKELGFLKLQDLKQAIFYHIITGMPTTSSHLCYVEVWLP